MLRNVTDRLSEGVVSFGAFAKLWEYSPLNIKANIFEIARKPDDPVTHGADKGISSCSPRVIRRQSEAVTRRQQRGHEMEKLHIPA
jgi:hypothetical protein